jgi:hypothetical protein
VTRCSSRPRRPSEAHGAFLAALANRSGEGGAIAALVDESEFRERWRNDPVRLDERRASWRAVCAERRVDCIFVALAAPDLAAAENELERLVEESSR